MLYMGMYQASQSYAVNKASSSCFETSRHKSNKKCVPDKISQVLKYQYLPNKKGKLFVSGQTSKEFMPVSVQSVSLLYCTSPIPKPSCELGMRRTFQKHIYLLVNQHSWWNLLCNELVQNLGLRVFHGLYSMLLTWLWAQHISLFLGHMVTIRPPCLEHIPYQLSYEKQLYGCVE